MRDWVVRFRPLMFSVCLLVLILSPILAAAQLDSSLSESLSPTPVESDSPAHSGIISPLSGETVSGTILLWIAPARSSRDYSVRVHVPRGDAIVLSPENSWMAPWDTTSLPDGPHSLDFENCLSRVCVSESVSITINNTPSSPSPPPVLAQEPSSVSPVRTRSRSRDREPSSSESPPPETLVFEIFPSNRFSFVELSSSGREILSRSTGDSFLVPSGKYSAHFTFSDFPVEEVFFENLSLVHDGEIIHFSDDFSIDPFIFRGAQFVPIHAFAVDVGFRFQSLRVFLSARESTNLFFCSDWSSVQNSCRVTWSPVPLDSDRFSLDVLSTSGVFAYASKRALPADTPSFSLSLANVPGDYWATDALGNELGPFDQNRVLLTGGEYSFRLLPFDSPFSGISLRGVPVDHNGVVFSVLNNTLVSSDTNDSFLEYVFQFSFPFEISSFRTRSDLDSTILSCPSYDLSSFSCPSPWSPLPPEESFSPGLNAFRFSRARSISDDNFSTPPLVQDANLLEAIFALKQLHWNKRFFYSENARATFPSLSTLFSDIEVDLQCDVNSLPGYLSTSSDTTSAPPSFSSPLLSDLSLFESYLVSRGDLSSEYFSPASPLFYSNAWEDFLPYRSDWRQREDALSCGGVSLTHDFSFDGSPPDSSKEIFLGGSSARVKERTLVRNDSNTTQLRWVNVRFTSPFASVATDENTFAPSSHYAMIPSGMRTVSVLSSPDDPASSLVFSYPANTILHFLSPDGTPVGVYDFSDLVVSGFSPRVLLHSRNHSTIVETLIPVSLSPGETKILDPIIDLNSAANFAVRWSGGSAGDYLARTSGFTSTNIQPKTPGAQILNIDNGSYANDLLLVAPYADINAKTDNGAVYLIKNIGSLSGVLDLSNTSNYSVAFSGSMDSDFLGDKNDSGPKVFVVNGDQNAYANDLIIGASEADGAATNTGAVYYVPDIDTKSGLLDLNNTNNFRASWVGSTAQEQLSQSFLSGPMIQVIDVDNNGYANDLVIGSTLTDTDSRVDNGVILLIKDLNRFSGINHSNLASSYSVIVEGSRDTDLFPSVNNSPAGMKFLDLDGNGYANDALFAAARADVGLTNNGAIYLILDIDKKAGVLDLNVSTSYNARWAGATASDFIPGVINSEDGYLVGNMDGNYSANDLIISAPSNDTAGPNRGSVYFIPDINTRTGNLSLLDTASYKARWSGATNADSVGLTNGSGPGILLVNIDNGVFANDLFIRSYVHNSNRSDNGAVFLIKDANTISGAIILNSTTSNYSVQIQGSVASSFLGDTNFSGHSLQIVNVDGNTYANDLLLGTSRMSTVAAATGAVYLIKDIDKKSGNLDLNTSTNFDVRWAPTALNDLLGSTNDSGNAFELVNLDGNYSANDLVFFAPYADLNGHANNGGVWIVRDINTLSGILSLDGSGEIQYVGAENGGLMGDTNGSGFGVTVSNLDNNAYSNDLLIASPHATTGNGNHSGEITIIRDVVSVPDGAYDLNFSPNFSLRYHGGFSFLELGGTADSNNGFQVVNADGNAYTNDLLFTAVLADFNGKSDSGAIYLIRDAVVAPPAADYSFVLNLPSSGCTLNKGNISGGSTCQRAWIEASSDLSGLTDENQIQPEGQSVSSSISFFVIDNQSTTSSDFNIFLDVNQAYSSNYVLKASSVSSGYQGMCLGLPSGCVTLTTTPQNIGKAVYSAGTADLNVYFWGDFISAPTGQQDRNVDTNSAAS